MGGVTHPIKDVILIVGDIVDDRAAMSYFKLCYSADITICIILGNDGIDGQVGGSRLRVVCLFQPSPALNFPFAHHSNCGYGAAHWTVRFSGTCRYRRNVFWNFVFVIQPKGSHRSQLRTLSFLSPDLATWIRDDW